MAKATKRAAAEQQSAKDKQANEQAREASLRIAKIALQLVSNAKVALPDAPEAYEAMQWLQAVVKQFEVEAPKVDAAPGESNA